jgi:Cu+-exporting ATPase
MGHDHHPHSGPAEHTMHSHSHPSRDSPNPPAKGEQSHASGAEGVIYTCPMHPQIRQVGPGSCPICGMALEPVVSTAKEGPSAELTDMTRRFWVGLALTVPVFMLEMGGHLLKLHDYLARVTVSSLRLDSKGST